MPQVSGHARRGTSHRQARQGVSRLFVEAPRGARCVARKAPVSEHEGRIRSRGVATRARPVLEPLAAHQAIAGGVVRARRGQRDARVRGADRRALAQALSDVVAHSTRAILRDATRVGPAGNGLRFGILGAPGVGPAGNGLGFGILGTPGRHQQRGEDQPATHGRATLARSDQRAGPSFCGLVRQARRRPGECVIRFTLQRRMGWRRGAGGVLTEVTSSSSSSSKDASLGRGVRAVGAWCSIPVR